jgi:hypothetical protein
VQAGVESLETRARLTGGSSSDAIYRMVADAVREHVENPWAFMRGLARIVSNPARGWPSRLLIN